MTHFKPQKTSIAACAALLINCTPGFAADLVPVVTETVPMAPMAVTPQSSGDWYASVFAGANSLSDVETDYNGDDYSVGFDSGFVSGLTYGKRISDTIRVEGELSFARAEANNYQYSYSPEYPAEGDLAEGDLDATYLLANVWFDIPTSGPLGFYVGGGVGAARVEADTYFSGGIYGYGGGETKLAAQIGVGVIYDISQTLALDVGYRYKYVGDMDLPDSDGSGVYEGAGIRSNSLQVGLAYNF